MSGFFANFKTPKSVDLLECKNLIATILIEKGTVEPNKNKRGLSSAEERLINA